MERTKSGSFDNTHAWEAVNEKKGEPRSDNSSGRLNLLGLTTLGLGGAIGSGIFVASGLAINQAGPSIILAFIVGGIISTLVMTMLGEMSVGEPTTGSFSVYAEEYLGSALGFITGWLYWLAGILTLSTEMVAAALIVRYWIPNWPIWLISLIIAALIIGIGLLNVQMFARVEEILSFIKVGILLLIIIFGVIAFTGLLPGVSSPGLTNYVNHGGFFPNSYTGFLSSLLLVLYTYAGEQVIGPATGDTREPEKTIPSAVRLINIILIVLYLGSMTTLVGLIPWNQVPQNGSGFVFLVSKFGVPMMTGIMNAVILSAILSAMNSNMYGVPRMLRSLAERHDAPAFLAKSKKEGVPRAAVLISSICLLCVVGISYILPQKIFAYIASASGVTLLLNWLLIAFTYVRFRKRKKVSSKHEAQRAAAFPLIAAIAIVLLLVALGTSALSSNQLVGIAIGGCIVLVLAACYYLLAKPRRLSKI